MQDTANTDDRPKVEGQGFVVDETGVYWRQNHTKTAQFVCGWLIVAARTRSADGDRLGYLLQWRDIDGGVREWAMPARLLTRSHEIIASLLERGLRITSDGRSRIIDYILSQTPTARVLSADRTGWVGSSFVLPHGTLYAHSSQRVVLEGEFPLQHHAQSGSLDEWRSHVAQPCAAHSRLVLTLCAAFAAPLLKPLGIESGGLHLVGTSSIGKTTALSVACAVYGAPSYLQRWRATANGLEGLAAAHCDLLLALDELGQIGAREAGAASYALANGQAKARASMTGHLQARREWRVMILSSGEVGLVEHLSERGLPTRAGQEVRLLDMPADAGAGCGIFDAVGKHTCPAELAWQMKLACTRFYGTAGQAFIQRLLLDHHRLLSWWNVFRHDFITCYAPTKDGWTQRAAERFALLAAAGSLASEYGITGWNATLARESIVRCMRGWHSYRQRFRVDESPLLERVRGLLASKSRFVDLDRKPVRLNVADVAGAHQTTAAGEDRYYVLPEIFADVLCKGLDPRRVARELRDAGWLVPGENGRAQSRKRIPSVGNMRVYCLRRPSPRGGNGS